MDLPNSSDNNKDKFVLIKLEELLELARARIEQEQTQQEKIKSNLITPNNSL